MLRRSAITTTVLAAALTAACADAPLGPTPATPSARASHSVEKPAPTPSADAPISALLTVRVPNDTAKVFGTSVRFSTEQTFADVVDNEAGDASAIVGSYKVQVPGGAMFHRADLLTVPIGYMLPTTPIYASVKPGSNVAIFKEITLSAKKVLQINAFDMGKKRAVGGSFEVTSPGMDLKYTITDGGAGDLTPMGKQAPADGQINVYLPSYTIGSWTVCETAAPTGFLKAEPSCQTVKTTSLPKQGVNFSHLTGIIVTPPPAPGTEG